MLTYLAMRAVFALSRHVPLAWRYRVGTLGGEAVYWLWAAKRRNTCRNMAVVADAREVRHVRALARDSWRNYGRYIVDFFNLPNVPPAEAVRRTDVRGWENLDRAMEAGKGVIFVTCHFGLWDYAPGVLATRYPGRMHVVAEPFASPRMDDLIQSQRAAQGSTVIPMTAVRQMVRALRRNGMLALLVDRPTHGDGVPIQFFGRPTMVPAGAATLALLTGATVLPGYLLHRSGDRYEGCIMPPVEITTTGDRDADVRHATQSIFAAIERIIQRSPRHWYMFRDMWIAPAAAAVEAGAPA